MLRIALSSLLLASSATALAWVALQYGANPQELLMPNVEGLESFGELASNTKKEPKDGEWVVEYVDANALRDISTISTGQRVNVENYVTAAGYTIIEFTGDW